MTVRLKDIARELGLSAVTVSKALRNHADISEETRARVLKRIQELNYRPNLAARALVTGRTYSIGLIVPDLVHPFFGEVAKALSGSVRAHGYGVLISSSEEDPKLESEEIEHMLARRVDAVVIASAQWTVKSLREMEARGTPYVLIDRKFVGLAANYVGIDDELAGVMATEHLIQAGCRRVAHIRGPEVSTAVGRLEGYRRALSRHGIEQDSAYVVSEGLGDESGELNGHRAMRELLALERPPDGVFCYNDPTAMGAMRAILEGGLRVPEDVAIIGCGNVRYADSLRVPLSSIDQSSAEIGRRAGELALSLVADKEPRRPVTILLQPAVVARASTARGRSPGMR